MTSILSAILPYLISPALLVGNFTYLLQLSSVLMRNIAWLRILAIVAGLAKIVYRLFFVFDPVSVFWESVFLVVNVGQLIIIWWENRPPDFSEEERYFIETVAPEISFADARALLDSGVWTDLQPETVVTIEGEPVRALVFIAEGIVRIERGGTFVGACGAGDFLGEMTYASGKPATATATAEEPVRCLMFERSALEEAQRLRPVLRMALHASFNRNLIDKLLRSNGSIAQPSKAPASA